ncbi:hypothetical protein PUN4_960026 [Paraburkholderia unamae]|nr:hypothetical protein PUN4_960026 [Paraburkholderia unamae]
MSRSRRVGRQQRLVCRYCSGARGALYLMPWIGSPGAPWIGWGLAAPDAGEPGRAAWCDGLV